MSTNPYASSREEQKEPDTNPRRRACLILFLGTTAGVLILLVFLWIKFQAGAVPVAPVRSLPAPNAQP